MKIASKNRLSLRKLFTAMLAVGPLAVLPSPVWAVLPTSSSFTVTNGSATLATSGSTVNINFSDKAILSWGATAGTALAPNRGVIDGTTITNFVVDTGDTWNFASGGSVLNKVVAGTNPTNGSLGGAAAAAIINGSLLGSNAKVFVLANGGIVVGNGAQLNTQSLILSTIGGENDGTFITLGDLTYNGSATGSITIGSITGGGSLTAVGSSVSLAGGSVGGDLVLRSVTAGSPITLSTVAATTVGGNLTVTTNSGPISQGAFSLGVGALNAGDQTATLNSGTSTITLANNSNDFEVVVANTSGLAGNVTLSDKNLITLGASSIGGDLKLNVGGQTSTTAISTSGALVIGGNASFDSFASANSSVTIANGSSITGAVNANTSGGLVTITTTGNLTLGTINTNNAAIQMDGVTPWPVLTAGPVITNSVTGTVTSIPLASGAASPLFTGNVTATISSPIASATPQLRVLSIAVTDGGSGYTSVPAVTFTNTNSANAAANPGLVLPTATAVLSGGATGYVTSITVNTQGGGYATLFPSVTIAAAPSSGTSAKAQTYAELSSILLDDGGSGYNPLAPVTTTISGGNAITVGTATATVAPLTDKVSTVTVGTRGIYTSTPSIVVSHPNPNAAPAAAIGVRDTNTGFIPSLTITDPGVGYGTTVPTVTFPSVSVANVGNITANTTGTITNTGVLTSTRQITLRGSTVITGASITAATGNTQAQAVFTSNSGDITFGGGTITANRINANSAGNITLTAGDIKTLGRAGNVTANDPNTLTAKGNITLDAVALSINNNQPILVTAQNASIRSTNNITLGNTAVTGNLTLRAGSTSGSGSNRNITLGRGDSTDATPIVVGGVLNATTDGSGGIFDNNDSRIEVYGGLNLQTGYNNGGALIKGGAITLDAGTYPGALTPSIRLGLVNASTGLTTGGDITLAEDTTLNLGNITGGNLTASAATGGIVDTGVINLGAGGIAAFTVSGSNNVVLDTPTNVIPVITVTGGKDNSFTLINSSVELRSATGAAGNTTVATNPGYPISIGAIATTGNVVVNSGSYIDVVGNANIMGDLTLNATGTVGATDVATKYSSVYAGTATINNTTGSLTGVKVSNPQLLSFGIAPTITVTGGSTPTTTPAVVTSTVTNGVVTAVTGAGGTGYTIAPTVNLAAPNVSTAAGGVQATATATIAGGAITGYTITNAGAGYAVPPIVTLVGGGSPTTVATVTANLGTTGQIAGNATFVVTNTNGGLKPYSSANPINVDITSPSGTTTSILQSAGTLVVSGTTSISAPGNAILFRANDFANVVLNNTSAGALINDVNNVTVSGVAAGNLDIGAGSIGGGSGSANGVVAIVGQPILEANAWGVTLGTLNVGSLNVTASNGGAANSGQITQVKNSTIHSYGPAYFTTTNNSITIGNNGNNFGRIGAATGSGANSGINITIVEDGTMKIGNITQRGPTTLTSNFGGIIEDTQDDVVILSNGTLTASAPNGSILLGNTTHVIGTTTANVTVFVANAGTGQVAVTSNNSTTLGKINANSLSVEVNGGNGNISQNGVITVYGSATFSAGAPATAIAPIKGGDITLTNNANNFGRIFLTTIGPDANIAIAENATMNLGRVTMPATSTGTFSATSITGDIMDTGLGGVKPGGTNASPGTGVTTLSAVAGNIILDDPTTDFPSTGGVLFTSGNVTLSPLGGAGLYLGAAGSTAVATGNLTVTSATGSIFNAGPVNIAGDAFFQSGSGDILMTNSSNNFGTVKFAGKIVSITEAGHLTLVTGSSATGAATFTTAGGDIAIVNRGGTISLASTGLFNASGSITLPKLIQVSDTLTVSAAGTKDLSKLSVSGDLGNKNPQNFGTGTYLQPLP